MGQDKISQQMLELVSPVISPIPNAICNCSFTTSTVPVYWKEVLINFLLKTPTPLLISDTGPIALLPQQSKIVERESFNQLLIFLEDNKFLDPRQACYR